MGKFIESQTAINIQISFSAETQARTRYNFFARRAEDEGYIQIAKLFDETAEQEYEHALRFFKFFNGGQLRTDWPFPAGVIEDTRANLLSSAALELYVHDDMYKGFAETARVEGFTRAADTFDAIIVSEKHHEEMFRELAEHLKNDTLFTRSTEQQWKCIGCGYIHNGKEPPKKCPACVRTSNHFELLVKRW